MDDCRSILGQLHVWLADRGARDQIQALIDLPDVRWVEILAFAQGGDLLTLTYRALPPCKSRNAIVHLVCPASALVAVRKVDRTTPAAGFLPVDNLQLMFARPEG